MNLSTPLMDVGFELLQIEVEVFDGVVFQVSSLIAQRFKLGHPGHGGGTLAGETGLNITERFL